MINPRIFFDLLTENGIDFYSGIPDSLLKNFCSFISDHVPKTNHIIAANEGGALSLGAGYYLATGKTPLIYLQNSGLGNVVNPLLSLADKKVYNIPILLMVGWRGEPGVADEPQHIKQGEVTTKLLNAMDIQYKIIQNDFEEAKHDIITSIKYIRENSCPSVFIIRKDLFGKYESKNKINTDFEMSREEAIKIIVDSLDESNVIVSTTGKTSRELFEYRKKMSMGHEKDFLTVGSMGHSSQIALGIALQINNKQIYCFDGDGSTIMHAGSMGIIGSTSPENFKHIILNNGAHDSVGGQPTIGFDIDFRNLALAFNYRNTFSAKTSMELKKELANLKHSKGPSLLEIKISKGSRKNLGRPTASPLQNKHSFMRFLHNKPISPNK